MTFERALTEYGQWGYLVVLIGTFLEGESILVAAGFMAHEGYLSLPGVIASAFAGSFAGDQLYFFIGRMHGKRFLEKRPKMLARAARVHALLERWHTGFILAFRFLYGLRTVSPFVLGTSSVPTARFFFLNMIGAIVWSISIGTAGYLFGTAVKQFLGAAKEYETYILGGLVVTGIIVSAVMHLRARNKPMEPAPPSSTDPEA